MNVVGLPKVIIPHEIYEKCMGWMDATNDEVSWRGLADWDENSFRITEVFLPKQKASSANVEVFTAQDGGDFGKWLTNCLREGKYQNDRGECRYKWHMHKHPGNSWGSLFESSTDEDNTEHFGVRDINWMMVGRAVDSGKFRVCLEVFKPFRISFDFIPVFVEYQGSLIQVSEPGKETEIESIPKMIFEDKINLKEEAVFGEVEMAEREVVAPTFHQQSFYNDFDYCEAPPTTIPNSQSTIPVYRTHYRRKERIIKISSLSVERPTSSLYCIIRKENGLFSIEIRMKVGLWDIAVEKMPLSIQLPEIPAIREEAKAEVEEKVSKSYFDHLIPQTWRMKSQTKTDISKKRKAKSGKGVKNGSSKKPVSRFPKPGSRKK